MLKMVNGGTFLGIVLGKLSVPGIGPKSWHIFGTKFVVKENVMRRRRGHPKRKPGLQKWARKRCSHYIYIYSIYISLRSITRSNSVQLELAFVINDRLVYMLYI